MITDGYAVRFRSHLDGLLRMLTPSVARVGCGGLDTDSNPPTPRCLTVLCP